MCVGIAVLSARLPLAPGEYRQTSILVVVDSSDSMLSTRGAVSVRPSITGKRLGRGSAVDALACILLAAIMVFPYRSGTCMEILGAQLSWQECMQIALAILAGCVIVGRPRVDPASERVALVLIVVALASAQLIAAGGHSFTAATQQMRSFMPLAVAVLVILAPWRLSRPGVVVVLCAALVGSAAIAMLMHLAFREHLSMIAGDNPGADLASVSGRMLWHTGAAAILAPLVLCYGAKRMLFVSMLGLSLVGIAVILTQNRTLTFGLLVSGLICLSLRGRSLPRSAAVLAVLAATAASVAALLMSESEWALLLGRMGWGDADAELQRAFDVGRLPLYEQYWSAMSHAPIVGSGLGGPLAVLESGEEVYTSDISVVHIMVPLGVSGIALLVWFIAVCRHRLARRWDQPNCSGAAISWLVVLLLLLSLNVDMWCRNVVPIALAFVVSAGARGSRDLNLGVVSSG